MQRRISACASCKHQRKKCTENCALAPHFPVGKSREFRAVHKIFGVSNVTKMVTGLQREDDRKSAVESLTWEALCWGRDPVWGPYGAYRRVWEEMRMYKSYYHRAVVGNSGKGSGNSPFCPYVYPSCHAGARAEREMARAVLMPRQNFATRGPYNPLDSKSMESTLWEESS